MAPTQSLDLPGLRMGQDWSLAVGCGMLNPAIACFMCPRKGIGLSALPSARMEKSWLTGQMRSFCAMLLPGHPFKA